MDNPTHSLAKIALLLALIVGLCVALGACQTVPIPTVPPAVTAAIDCALPALWNAVTPSAVEADAASAIAAHDPLAALALLADAVGEAEVTCVVAKRDAAVRAQLILGGAASVTTQWLNQEAAKGLRVTNFQGMPPG